MDWLRTTDFAHRGLHGHIERCPENSMPAIEEAIDHGYGIEIDIQRSMDNEAIVFHDLSLKRLTGKKGLVANLQAHELRKIRFRGSSHTIPTLKQVLDLVEGRVPLLLEIKNAPGIPGMLEMRVAELIRRYSGPLAVMSWTPTIVKTLALLAPGIPSGRVISKLTDLQVPERAKWLQKMLTPKIGFDSSTNRQFAACALKSLLSEHVPEERVGGAPLLTWTVTSSEEARRARALADGIIFEGFRP
jgi:glycerophosphoryl diester phosphodiesterase